jgi:hypothetical protein
MCLWYGRKDAVPWFRNVPPERKYYMYTKIYAYICVYLHVKRTNFQVSQLSSCIFAGIQRNAKLRFKSDSELNTAAVGVLNTLK